MSQINSHRDLIVWQKGIKLVDMIYKITKDFPKFEIYGLANQMQRAAVSIPSNIAEGRCLGSKKEFSRFLRISLGSTAELDTQIQIALNREYVSKEEYETIYNLITEIIKMLSKLITNLNK